MTDHERVGRVESVEVDGQVFTGTVYHVRRNGWACLETNGGHIASGPAAREAAAREREVAMSN